MVYLEPLLIVAGNLILLFGVEYRSIKIVMGFFPGA